MALAPGTRFGTYEILAILGAGGMGEVYRARDARLNREVALKVLPELFALDPDRVARFRREAQVLASISHPNIAAIYGLEGPSGSCCMKWCPASAPSRETTSPTRWRRSCDNRRI